MSIIQFNCPICQQSYEAEEDTYGENFTCPSCGVLTSIPNRPEKVKAKSYYVIVDGGYVAPLLSIFVYSPALSGLATALLLVNDDGAKVIGALFAIISFFVFIFGITGLRPKRYTCSKCNGEVVQTANYCEHCLAPFSSDIDTSRLEKCTDCKKVISKSAVRCPYCGA